MRNVKSFLSRFWKFNNLLTPFVIHFWYIWPLWYINDTRSLVIFRKFWDFSEGYRKGANPDIHWIYAAFSIVKDRRFELRTTWLKVRCSTDWANPPYLILWKVSKNWVFGIKPKNWARWIRTIECRSQSPVPYRLAIAQCLKEPSWTFLNPHKCSLVQEVSTKKCLNAL